MKEKKYYLSVDQDERKDIIYLLIRMKEKTYYLSVDQDERKEMV